MWCTCVSVCTVCVGVYTCVCYECVFILSTCVSVCIVCAWVYMCVYRGCVSFVWCLYVCVVFVVGGVYVRMCVWSVSMCCGLCFVCMIYMNKYMCLCGVRACV